MSSSTSRPATRRRLPVAALVVAGVFVAASCGSDDGDSSAEEQSTTDAAVTTETVSESTAPPATASDTTEPTDTTGATDTTDAGTTEGELWTATAPNMTPAEDDTAAEWQQLTEEALAASIGTPGVIIAVSHPELGFWTSALGDAEVDVEPMTTEHHSRIGSITKTMTAVAVLQQVDEGNMSLDDTVGEVVPEIAEQFPATADLTVEDLLSMSSGLPDYANVPGAVTAQAVLDPTKVWTPEEIIAVALDVSDVEPVGTEGYSTTNFTILGLMYEAVTGETIEDGIGSVVEEAGLTETALPPGDENEMPDPSTNGYVDEAAVDQLLQLSGQEIPAGTDVTEWSLSWGGAGGGAYSTIEDLFLWASTGSGNTLLSTDLGEQRLELDSVLIDAGIVYGLGLMSAVDGWIGHTGQAIGWEALGMYDPETGGTIAVLTNSTGGLAPFYGVWDGIFDLGIG